LIKKKGTKPTEKNFVLDTNVLIHNPHAIYSFADNRVIIPIMVIEELDRLKIMPDKKGMHAREILREIDGLIKKGALKKGARMNNGGTLIIAVEDKEEIKTLPSIDKAISDNKILTIAWQLQKKGKMVFFVSKDVNARIKAEALGIKAVDYEKQKVEYGNLYKGWKDVVISPEEMDQLSANNNLPIKGHSFYENEYALVRTENDIKQMLCKYDSSTECMVPVRDSEDILGILPLNTEQRIAFELLLNDNIKLVTLVGQAGTGKTLLAIACALSKIVGRTPLYERLLIVRPIVPLGKDIGYLPGSKEKKLTYWMQPIYDNLEFILKKAYTSKDKDWSLSDLTIDNLTKSEMMEVEALTYIRGRSIPNQFMIVDEAQNLTPHEIKTIISRAGDGTKIVLTGDPDQIDNPYLDANSNGLSYTVERLKKSGIFGNILLTKSERSELAALAVDEL